MTTPKYETFANCQQCDWQLSGDYDAHRRVDLAAAKHTKTEGHATCAGLLRVSPLPARR